MNDGKPQTLWGTIDIQEFEVGPLVCYPLGKTERFANQLSDHPHDLITAPIYWTQKPLNAGPCFVTLGKDVFATELTLPWPKGRGFSVRHRASV